MPRGFLYLLPHFIIAIEVEHIGDKVKSILIVLYFGVQAGEVETVRQVFLIDLAKVLVSPRRYELTEIKVSKTLLTQMNESTAEKARLLGVRMYVL